MIIAVCPCCGEKISLSIVEEGGSKQIQLSPVTPPKPKEDKDLIMEMLESDGGE